MKKSMKRTSSKVLSVIIAALLILSTVQIGLITAFATDVFTITVKDDATTPAAIEGAIVSFNATDDAYDVLSATTDKTGSVSFSDITEAIKADNTLVVTGELSITKSGYIYEATELVINAENYMSVVEKVMSDVEKPVINNISGNPTDWATTVTLVIEATDNVEIKEYKINEEAWQSNNSISISENGNYNVFVKDKAGNISDAYSIVVEKLDNKAPVISGVQINPEDWTNKAVQVIVNASDDGYGMTGAKYKMDNGEWQDSNVFVVSDAAVHDFYVKDALGNTSESTKASADKYDKTAPVIEKAELYWSVDQKIWFKGNLEKDYTSNLGKYKIIITASDNNGSGISKYAVSSVENELADNLVWQDSAEFIVDSGSTNYFYVIDNAENISSVKRSLLYDVDAPVINSVVPSTTEFTKEKIIFTVDATDNKTSTDKLKYAISEISNAAIDNLTWQSSNNFKISDSDIHYIYVKDSAKPNGNMTSAYAIQAKNFDGNAPIINENIVTNGSNEYKDAKNNLWYSSDVKVTGSVVDNHANETNNLFDSGIANVYYSENENAEIKDCALAFLTNGAFSFTVSKEETYQGTYYIWAVDNAGNISECKTVKINIDKTPPILVDSGAIEFKTENDNPLAKLGNILTFGAFFKEKIVATVKVTDTESGIGDSAYSKGRMILVEGDREYSSKASKVSVKDESITFEYDIEKLEAIGLTIPFTGSVKFEICDNAGNQDTYIATTENSNLLNTDAIIMIESTSATISIITADYITNPETKEPVIVDDKTVFNDEINFAFSVQDENSGLYSVNVEVNGKTLNGYPKYYSNAKTTSLQKFIFDSASALDSANNPITANNDGSYFVFVTAVDNAGNESTNSCTVYKDTTSAKITKYNFSSRESSDSASNPFAEVQPQSYGFFFKYDTTVTITAEDPTIEYELASGVKSITVELKDVDGNTYYVKSNNSDIINKNTAGNNGPFAVAVDENNQITFTIPANFKGQIYSYATDNVDNSEDFVHPDGTVVEDGIKHTETSTISITAPQAAGTESSAFVFSYSGVGQADKVMAYDTTQNVPLYNSDVEFDISVEDSYSGIKDIKTVLYYQDKNGEVKNDNIDVGWSEVKEANLITGRSGTVAINNNYNNMTLLVELTDNAGNVSYDFYTFGIDKTAPAIDLEYTNNVSDSGYTSFFKADRTAVIYVTERNFDESLFEYNITNEHGVVPTLSDWEQVVSDEKDPENNRYKATVDYNQDGDYIFDMACTDRATNENSEINTGNSVAAYAFTIDKTMPTIRVAYDNNTSKTGTNFYDAQRIATITITEHNFDATRVVITGTADDDGSAISFPAATAWTNSGDVHTASITYSADAKYTFDIAFNDMAGNNAADYAMDEFYIDNTDPIVEILGTENDTSNSFNGDISPVITFFDKNFDAAKATYTFTGVKNGKISTDSYSAVAESAGNGNTVTYTLFNQKTGNKYNRDYDDIYSITADITDLAGRTATATKTFSVNRFGSSYDLSELSEINGQYFSSEKDVVFTETNVNDISNIILTLFTADSVGKTLELATSAGQREGYYSIEKISTAGQWSVYRYVIFAENFKNDGKYTVTVYSEDAAGNKNDSTDESKSTNIEFVIDKVAPVINSETLDTQVKDNNKFNETSKQVIFSVSDNHEIKLDTLNITVDGAKVEYEEKDGKYIITLNESNHFQTVEVSVKDAADQTSTLSAEALVSTNFFVRWYNNKIAFIASLAGVGVLAAAIIFIVVMKNKNDDKSDTKKSR